MPRSCCFPRRCLALPRPCSPRRCSARSSPSAGRRRPPPTSRSTTPGSRCSSISSPAGTSPTPRRWCGRSAGPTRSGPWLHADTAGEGTAALIRHLREELREPADSNRWQVGLRAGAQAYSHIRRDLLHPLGPDGVRPYGEALGEAILGPFALVSRPAAEPRLTDDPEWPGRRDLDLAWRMIEGYASAQFKYGSVFYGQMDRNWGPVGIEGIGLSDYGYNDVELGFDIGVDALRLSGARPVAGGRARQHRRPGPPLLLRPPARRPAGRPAPTSACGRRRCSPAPTASSTGATATRSPCCSSPTSTGSAPTATCCSGSTRRVASAGHHGRGPARHRRPPVREHHGRRPLSQSLGPHPRRARAARLAGSPGAASTPRPRASPSAPSTPSRTSPTAAWDSAAISPTWTRSP